MVGLETVVRHLVVAEAETERPGLGALLHVRVRRRRGANAFADRADRGRARFPVRVGGHNNEARGGGSRSSSSARARLVRSLCPGATRRLPVSHVRSARGACSGRTRAGHVVWPVSRARPNVRSGVRRWRDPVERGRGDGGEGGGDGGLFVQLLEARQLLGTRDAPEPLEQRTSRRNVQLVERVDGHTRDGREHDDPAERECPRGEHVIAVPYRRLVHDRAHEQSLYEY